MKFKKTKLIFIIMIALILFLFIFYNNQSKNKVTHNIITNNVETANSLYENGNFEKALEIYNKIQLNDSNSIMNKATCEIRLNKYKSALETISVLEKQNITNNQIEYIYNNKIICYYYLGLYENVLINYKYVKYLYEKFIEFGSVYNYVVESYMNLKKYDDCIESIKYTFTKYQNEINNNNNYCLILNNYLQTAYISKGDLKSALYTNNTIIKLDSDNIENYLLHIYLLSELEGKESAKNYINSIKDKFPNNKELKNRLNDLNN